MNITKRDVLELRRRLSKKGCSFQKMSGCYVNGNKEVILQFTEQFLELEEDEFYKYLEIAKKTLSGTLGNNLLELEFERGEDAAERQQFFLTLKASKLGQPELLKRFYEQVIQNYSYAGNYLILVFHDVYDVITRTSDRAKLDESEEIYEYILCAICPVELSKPGLGYQEEEHRIGVRARDWVVGLPDIGFLYPAFSNRGSDTNAMMYYVKNGKDAHPEFVTKTLGCQPQRTAHEEKQIFQELVQTAFGEQVEEADDAFLKIQRNLNGLLTAAEELDETQTLTPAAVSDLLEDMEMPAAVREQIEQSYGMEFGETPPLASHLLDSKLAAQGMQRAQTMDLQKRVTDLQQQLAEQRQAQEEAPWESGEGVLSRLLRQFPEERRQKMRTELVDGQKCLLIPLEEGEELESLLQSLS